MEKYVLSSRNTAVGYQTVLSNGRLGYLADEPVEDGGTGLGFRPHELLLAGLAACKAMTARYLARQKGWPLEEAFVDLELDTQRVEGKTVSVIRTRARFTGDLTEEQRAALLKVLDKCPVHRLLSGEIHLEDALF